MTGPAIRPLRPRRDGTYGPGRPAWVTGLAYAPDGRSLATTGHEKVVRVWDPETGRERFTVPASDPAYSPDRTTLAVGSRAGEGGSVALLDASTGRVKSIFPDSKFGPVAFLPGGAALVGLEYGEDLTVRLWDVATGQPRDAIRLGHAGGHAIARLAVSPDGRTVALAGLGNAGYFGWIDLVETDGTSLRLWKPHR
jgi:WD40 repeat protein